MKTITLLLLATSTFTLAACEVEGPKPQHGYYTRPGVEYNSYGVERYDHDQNYRDDTVYEGRNKYRGRPDYDYDHNQDDDGDYYQPHRADGATRHNFGHCLPGLDKQGRC